MSADDETKTDEVKSEEAKSDEMKSEVKSDGVASPDSGSQPINMATANSTEQIVPVKGDGCTLVSQALVSQALVS